MQKKETQKKVAPVVEQKPKEEINIFENGLLYGGYSVISNKTVRTKEKLLIRWRNNNTKVPGKEMVKTNRGYFLDGYNIDERSIKLWFSLTGLNRNQKPKKYETRKNRNRAGNRTNQ
jgi:hypothetical protein